MREDARRRRDRASRKHRPAEVKLLLVAEAPPAALDRYFYFEDVRIQDSLFRYVVRAILKRDPTRETKREDLAALRDRGVFLLDLKQEPRDDSPLASEVPGLIRRVKRLAPRKVILIKTTVYDAAFADLRDAGLPVVDERVPFPGSGQQRRFEEAFARALGRRVHSDSKRSRTAHASDSAVQREAETKIVDGVAKRIGVRLAKRSVELPGGASAEVDGVSEDYSVFVEAFARQGAMKGGQKRKVALDTLKLITLRRQHAGARAILAFCDRGAADSLTGWAAEAVRMWDVEVAVVSIPQTLRRRLLETQARQFR